MKTYLVSIPIAGAMHVEVKASSESAAKKAAWALVDEKGPDAGDVEWEFFEILGEGNVSHTPLNEIEVSELK